jgi:hypothetical protein
MAPAPLGPMPHLNPFTEMGHRKPITINAFASSFKLPSYIRMARGGHGLPKVLPGPAMPCSSTPCGRATPETALQPFQEWPAPKGRSAAVFYPLGDPTPYAYGRLSTFEKLHPLFIGRRVWETWVRHESYPLINSLGNQNDGKRKFECKEKYSNKNFH